MKKTKSPKIVITKKKERKNRFVLYLFVSGTSTNSMNAITNIKRVCEMYLKNRYELKIIDIYQQPEELVSMQILAVPVLIKKFPLPEKRMIGDLSNTEKVQKVLDLREE